MTETPPPFPTVRKRRVLFVSGFDPQGHLRYYPLYRDEAAKQCKSSGHRLELGPRKAVGPQLQTWQIDATIEGEDCNTTYDFLRWDDIVRQHWFKGHVRYWGMTLGATWRLFSTGVLWLMLKGSMPGFYVCFRPFLMVLAELLGSGLLLMFLVLTAMRIGPQWSLLAVAAVCGAGLYGLNWLGKRAENEWQMGWVMRSYWFTTKQGRKQLPELDQRLDHHADYLLKVLEDPSFDEILVVGHSSGAMMAASIVGRACKLAPEKPIDLRLSLLTLGQCFPILTFQPQAGHFRAELAAVAETLDGRWVDVTAPPDGCCAALVDPLEAVRALGTSVACEPSVRYLGKQRPKVLSPQFANLFTPEVYAEIRKNHSELHFQYLKASQIPGTYDFFAITAGPQRLAQRFAHQPTVRDYRAFQCFGGSFPWLRDS